MKNVCFLVCTFSTTLQRVFLLINHGSDLKIIIVKIRGGGKERSHWISFALILNIRENFLVARISSPSLDACAYSHSYR